MRASGRQNAFRFIYDAMLGFRFARAIQLKSIEKNRYLAE